MSTEVDEARSASQDVFHPQQQRVTIYKLFFVNDVKFATDSKGVDSQFFDCENLAGGENEKRLFFHVDVFGKCVRS